MMSIVTDYKNYTNTEYIDEIGKPDKYLNKYFPHGELKDLTAIEVICLFTKMFRMYLNKLTSITSIFILNLIFLETNHLLINTILLINSQNNEIIITRNKRNY